MADNTPRTPPQQPRILLVPPAPPRPQRRQIQSNADELGNFRARALFHLDNSNNHTGKQIYDLSINSNKSN
jgi:hypothetical protein